MFSHVPVAPLKIVIMTRLPSHPAPSSPKFNFLRLRSRLHFTRGIPFRPRCPEGRRFGERQGRVPHTRQHPEHRFASGRWPWQECCFFSVSDHVSDQFSSGLRVSPFATMTETYLAGVRSCRQYRRLMRTPCSEILSMAASDTETPSVVDRIRTIRLISSAS